MKRLAIFAVLVAFTLLVADIAEAQTKETARERQYITAETVNRRVCEPFNPPSMENCPVTSKALYREGYEIYEVVGDWARVSHEYWHSIPRQIFGADWIHRKYLSPQQPAQHTTENEWESLVVRSENFTTHRKVFADAARRLVESGTCTEGDLKVGFWRSVRIANRYVTVCGTTRFYLNVSTGKLERG